MMYGTCRFVDAEAAVSYYSRYGFGRDEVCEKIKQSESWMMGHNVELTGAAPHGQQTKLQETEK